MDTKYKSHNKHIDINWLVAATMSQQIKSSNVATYIVVIWPKLCIIEHGIIAAAIAVTKERISAIASSGRPVEHQTGETGEKQD